MDKIAENPDREAAQKVTTEVEVEGGASPGAGDKGRMSMEKRLRHKEGRLRHKEDRVAHKLEKVSAKLEGLRLKHADALRLSPSPSPTTTHR